MNESRLRFPLFTRHVLSGPSHRVLHRPLRLPHGIADRSTFRLRRAAASALSLAAICKGRFCVILVCPLRESSAFMAFEGQGSGRAVAKEKEEPPPHRGEPSPDWLDALFRAQDHQRLRQRQDRPCHAKQNDLHDALPFVALCNCCIVALTVCCTDRLLH